MQRDTFSYLVTNPSELSSDDLVYLEQLVEHYPFCQTGHVLLAKGYTHDSKSAEASLRKAAAYALSRNALRKFMEGDFPQSTSTTDQALPFTRRHAREVVEVSTKPFFEEINPVQALRGLDYSEVLLKKNEEKPETEPQESNPLDQLSIIDRFIQAEPRIGPLRAKLGQPEEIQVDLAQKPQQSHSTPVTEAYAKVLARQGKTEKAIEVYEKLQLKFPEKKTYFAEKIEALKNNPPLS
ncbi:hypothetical protein [Siphonobacter sp. SORGH_AS_1065]|uniref:hypothetical protein n=1 Tax=Siphonobacter sp. SORGH_AS_1065 TaxID=3041795 RepID=UPI00277E8491|nr:hypothetical protein [Siphonobacter sp. SORGH_AS_1065]MDQ1088528.1 tetratricopeptide (TPR) repeat protein [Siphonobacter sp. SORGH_AS_1065]